jgi:hypothetical protein
MPCRARHVRRQRRCHLYFARRVPSLSCADIASLEPPSFPDLSSRRETANNVEAIDTAAPVRGFEFSADF